MKNLVNLYRINKFYGLIRELIDNPRKRRDNKHWIKIFKTFLSIREVQEMMQGYKTYIVAGLSAAVTVLHYLGYIDDETYKTLMALLGAGAVSTVAAKINRIEQNQPEKLTK